MKDNLWQRLKALLKDVVAIILIILGLIFAALLIIELLVIIGVIGAC